MDDDEFYGQQSELLRKIANEVIEATPEWWDRATLELVVTDEGCEHVITNIAHPRDVVTPPDKLFDVTWQLEELFRRRGEPWKKVVFNVWREGENWKYSADYMY